MGANLAKMHLIIPLPFKEKGWGGDGVERQGDPILTFSLQGKGQKDQS